MNKAQEYLEKIKTYDTLSNCRMLQAGKLDAKMAIITASMKGDLVSFSGSQDKLGETTAKFLTLEEKIYAEIDYYLEQMDKATALLDKLALKQKATKKEKPEEYYKVLFRRYVLYQTFEQIAKDMNYSERQIHNIHGNALVAFEKLMQEEQ